jgi:DNA invertase Pin-like site-specific DNA recombinase
MTDTLHIYTRVSTRVQDEEGTSLTTQKELGIVKSKELKMGHKVWNEGAASSHHEDLLNRPVLAQLLLDMERGVIKHLFVFNNDRLSRNEDTQFVIKSALRKNDVVLYTKDGQFDLNNPQDKLFKSLLDSVAEYDNALRAERSRLGKINRVRQGFWYGAPPPYGYSIVEGKLTPNAVESKWVKMMFRWFKDGQSIVYIKSQLDKEGVFARRGKLFTTGSINVLLQNTHHIGHYTWTDKKSGETIPCSCPAIVDETVWNEVQRRREQIFARKGQNNRTKRFYLLRNLMFCGKCGSQMSGRIHDLRNERVYFCPKKTRNWKNGGIPQDQKWKRGKVGEHGCDMNRSLNIPITDKFVWDTVMDAVSKSSTLKEGFKEEILHSKYAGDAETDRELKNLKTKSNRLRGDLQQVQSSIADVETNRLLQRYDEEVYSKIKSNLNAELKTKKDEIEQTRIRIKELGKERRWLDWVEKYGDRVGSLEDFSNEDKKEYLEGILRRIDVSLDKETNDHHLDLTFNLGLVGDGVEYSNTRDRSAGYEVVEGSKNASTVIPYTETQNRHKDARRTGRQEQSAIDLKKNGDVTYRNAKCDEGLTTYHRSPSVRDSRIKFIPAKLPKG